MTIASPRLPALAQTALLVHEPIGFLERCRERLGPVFRVRFPGSPPFAYVADPELGRGVFTLTDAVAQAGAARRPYLTPLLGDNSLLCLEGEEWKRQRRLLAPPLHGERIGGWRAAVAALAVEEIGRWPIDGRPFAVHAPLQRLSLEIILRLVFGVDDVERKQRLRSTIAEILGAIPTIMLLPGIASRLDGPAALRVPGNPLRRFARLRTTLDALVYAEIAARRAAGTDGRDDLLSLLLDSRHEDGSPMADVELRDELLTLLLAGHETTSTALAWALERIARHPEVEARLQDGESAYLDATIKETLRVRPVVPDAPRLLREGIDVGDEHVPAGWVIAPAIGLMQRDPEAFPDPERFSPERFDGHRPPPGSWVPFGGGSRRCIGSRLAMLELEEVLAVVLGRLRITAPRGAEERIRLRAVTLAPSRGARVCLRPR